LQQSFFVDDLATRDIDQNCSWSSRQKPRGRSDDGFFRPRTTNGDELALSKQVVQTIGGFQSREPGGSGAPVDRAPTRADDAHAGRGAEVCHLLADCRRRDNTYGLIPNYYGMVSLVIESAALFFCVAQVKSASEMEKARKHILSHGTAIGQPTRGSPKYPSPKDRYRENCWRRREARAPIAKRGARARKSFNGGQPVSTTSADASA